MSPAEQVGRVEFVLGASGGWTPVHFSTGRRRSMVWNESGCPGSAAVLADLARGADERWSEEVRVGLPVVERWRTSPTWATALWARTETRAQAASAAQFRPMPSIVLREGSSPRRWLLWPLRERVTAWRAEEFNKRIAYRIGSKQKDGMADVQFPLPGSCLRVGRKRPVVVVVSRLTEDYWTAEQVAGGLKDPPKPTWMERAA